METEQSNSRQTYADPIELLPPHHLSMPLWRSLLENLRDAFAGSRVPPLLITSKPVDVGMLLSDRVELPWFRTVFTNIGDAITPEILPPLQLESQPVDVGDLISDQLQRGWWASLLRNLADAVAPERQPPMHLTSAPVEPQAASTRLCVPRWSELIEAPKVCWVDQPGTPSAAPPSLVRMPAPTFGMTVALDLPPGDSTTVHDLTFKAKRALRFAHLREAFWISLAGVEITVLFVWLFGQK
jgi:hypothetical protein